MSQRTCPHCGYSLPDDASSCPCGLSVEDIDIPAPGIVRSAAQKEEISTESQPQKPKKPIQKAQVKKNDAADTPQPVRAVKAATSRPNDSLLMGCPSCAARISKRAQKCPKCGSAPFLPCQVCATSILANSASCGECGDPEPFPALSA